MASNPLYSTNDSPTNQTTPSKAVNRQGVYVPRTHNTFDMSYFNFTTQRFGQYSPFFVMEGVPGDHIPLSTSHNVRSLPFATPFLSSLKLNKDFFLVPNQAIQPHTWELIFKNPSQGDDVPEDAYNVFNLYPSQGTKSIIEIIYDKVVSAMVNQEVTSETIFYLLTLELFLSSGSILYNMDYKLNPIFDYEGKNYSFDEFFDFFFRNISDISGYIRLDERNLYFQTGDAFSSNYLPLSVVLDLIRFLGSSVVLENITYDGFGYFSMSNLKYKGILTAHELTSSRTLDGFLSRN